MYFTNYIPCVSVWFTAMYMDTKNAFSNMPRKITTAIQNYKENKNTQWQFMISNRYYSY